MTIPDWIPPLSRKLVTYLVFNPDIREMHVKDLQHQVSQMIAEHSAHLTAENLKENDL